MPEAVTKTMASLISELGTVVTAVLGWVADAVDTIVANPFLLITTGVLMLGGLAHARGRAFPSCQRGTLQVC